MTEQAKVLRELAERCEKATGPDRELDVRMSLAISGVAHSQADVTDLLRVRDEPTGYGRYRPADEYVPTYTASLDAAMSLVPEGWGWLVSQPNEKAIASGLLKARTPVHGEVQYGCDQRYAVAAATPALALTAAALRARAALLEQEERA